MCRKLANETPCAVIAVEYRQAPEHRFPAAVDDCFAATSWIANPANELGVDPTRVAIGGASAGGNLAAVVARLARDKGGPALACQVLVYPATDHRARGDTSFPGAFDRADADWCWSHYLGGASGDDPRASPLRAPDLRGSAAQPSSSRRSTIRYARKASSTPRRSRRPESRPSTQCYEAVHGFFSTPGSSAADAARARAVGALRRAFGDGVTGRAQ